ncbi:MAG: FAD-dependent monooxygenase [Ignavibacterium sp.]|jgi:2-polyprenyl-6-methoxyphenol hydroxylase-like FAD-dependent oxidoreductase|nr:FAD-dependent monooxygenase [Ignavibacterium sp.]
MKILINGGGIAGLTAAIALRKLGIETEVFESAQEIKPVGAGLVIQSNAIKALEYLGIEDDIIKSANPINQLAILNEEGGVIKNQKPASNNRELFSGLAIHRHSLHQILKSYLLENILFTNKKAISFSYKDEKVILHFENGSTAEGDFLIGADGINSNIRLQLLPHSKMRYAGYFCWRSIIENTNPKITEATETWGSNGRFGIVPINGNKIYWYATVNSDQFDVKIKHYSLKNLREHFDNYHSLVRQILEKSSDDNLIKNPICDIKPLNQFAFDKILLIGDAAHATTPNLGQGACQAIEDVMILHQEIASGKGIPSAFRSFERRRVEKTKFIIETSRKLGAIGQIENKFLISLRNIIFKLTPEFVTEHQFKKIYN